MPAVDCEVMELVELVLDDPRFVVLKNYCLFSGRVSFFVCMNR